MTQKDFLSGMTFTIGSSFPLMFQRTGKAYKGKVLQEGGVIYCTVTEILEDRFYYSIELFGEPITGKVYFKNLTPKK